MKRKAHLDAERFKTDERKLFDQLANDPIQRRKLSRAGIGVEQRFEASEILHFGVIL